MKEAYRVYSKNKKIDQMSPVFRSTVKRSKFNPQERKCPGPGHYEVTLPLVKPKYQAIYKNNRSIIIKVNDTPTAAFVSREPRFKLYGTLDSQPSLKQNKANKRQSVEKVPERYYASIPRKGSNEHLSSNFTPEIKQNTNNKDLRGPKWSKYTVKRNLWNHSQKQINPGPGSYHADNFPHRNYYLQHDDTSWQFKSITKRSVEEIKSTANQSNLEDSEAVVAIHSRANL